MKSKTSWVGKKSAEWGMEKEERLLKGINLGGFGYLHPHSLPGSPQYQLWPRPTSAITR